MAENIRNAEFLNMVYQNAQMAADSISVVSQKVQDEHLLSDLQTQHQQYSAITAKATAELANESKMPKEKNIVAQTAARSGIQMNTLMDKTPDHIAEIMIQGSMMGIIDMTRAIKQYEDVPKNIKALGYELVTVEENNVQRMKNYLG
ncbi:MAG: hypothetical protein LUG85_00735 [Clostridiales bacterium]|nr:hypothetical protein [Clostridiales bacterium]MCD7827054.1 hypothetical protein [Clostridiales bacterium]